MSESEADPEPEIESRAEPVEMQFACIGCGTFNPATAETCQGCGHRFAGHDVVSKVRTVFPPRPLDNPYEAPAAPIAPPGTFKIGSMLTWIALIAVCLGAFRAHISLGMLSAISFVPSTLWTTFRAGVRRAQGNPLTIEERCQSFMLVMLGTWGILLGSSIAFCVSCFSVGMITQQINFAFVFGAIIAVIFGGWLTSLLIKNGRQQIRNERDIRFR